MTKVTEIDRQLLPKKEMMNIQTSMTDRGALTVKAGSMLVYYYVYIVIMVAF